MILRDALIQYLQNLLLGDTFNDYAPNGLQVEGRSTIKRICTAVTASQSVIEQAADWQADALLVHHGFFWRGENTTITGLKRQRIGALITQDINLFAYHLPLDCHRDFGNNACLGRLLRAQDIGTHVASKTPDLLWSGVLETTLSGRAMSDYLSQVFQRTPLHISGSNKKITRIAWCSGAAQDFIEDAHRLGVDAYISGEVSERTYYLAQELGMHYFACGHHATERYGILTLGNHVAEQFGLQHHFIDSDNPV